MRKQKRGRKLSRKTDQRKALLRALVSAVILYEKIKTTEAKAKETRPLVEKLISAARKSNLASKRLLAGFLSPKVVKKIIEEVAPKYKDRPGGYTRIIKLGPRPTDGAKMAIIELVK